MYTKILAQGTEFGSGTTGLDKPAVQYCILCITRLVILYILACMIQY